MKNIILSGSTGFIGRNINKMLISCEKIKLDLVNLRKNSDEIEKEFKNKRYDIFIHSAGIHPFRDKLESPEIFSENKKIEGYYAICSIDNAWSFEFYKRAYQLLKDKTMMSFMVQNHISSLK